MPLSANGQSGERLCELVNTIRPNSVKKIARTTKPFQQMENIAACQGALHPWVFPPLTPS